VVSATYGWIVQYKPPERNQAAYKKRARESARERERESERHPPANSERMNESHVSSSERRNNDAEREPQRLYGPPAYGVRELAAILTKESRSRNGGLK